MEKLNKIAENENKISKLESDVNKSKKQYDFTKRLWVISGIASSVSMVGLVISPFAANVSTVGALGALCVSSVVCFSSMQGCIKLLSKIEKQEKDLTNVKAEKYGLENELVNEKYNNEELVEIHENNNNVVRFPYKKQNRSRVLKPEE